MPIQLNYTDSDTGINLGTSYWFVQVASIDAISNTIIFTINGYLNIAAKNSGKNPFLSKSVIATFSQIGLSGTNTINQLVNAAYNYALTYNDPATNTIFFGGGTIV